MNRVIEITIGVTLVLIMILVLILIIVFMPGQEEYLKHFLEYHFEKDASELCTKVKKAEWAHSTDLANVEKNQIYINATIERDLFLKKTWETRFKDLNPYDFKDEHLRRQVKILRNLGDSALDEAKLAKLSTVKVEMINLYASARICPFSQQDCNLDREGLTKDKTEELFATSDNYDELIYIWKAWREATGFRMKQLYKTYVELSNEAARANGFKDKGDQWRNAYESPLFSARIDKVWAQIRPFYNDLHQYVARKLKDHFEDKLDMSDGLIPSHVFRTMWMQSWQNLAAIVRPFKVDKLNMSFKSQGFTVLKMFEVANSFYKSMGLLPADSAYNVAAGAMIEKPTDDRQVDCTPAAVDFCDGKTYRVRICGRVGLRDFLNIHHEMGHIQYFLQYAKQPFMFRFGPNPGFHEAVGETMAMTSQTPKYLLKLKVLKEYDFNYESSINLLMSNAMKIVAFLPYGLILDKWRWDVFSGAIKPVQWNARWWEYRKQYQKVKPPTTRSEKDFDPAAIFHFASDFSYISFFVSQIHQFQFYKSLCIAAGEYDPKNKNSSLHNCDFSGSAAAGKKLSDGLKLGASEHWKKVLQVMTGETDLDATPLLEYFQPLREFLKYENNK